MHKVVWKHLLCRNFFQSKQARVELRACCPACASRNFDLTAEAVIAPWIRELAKLNRSSTKYYICLECGSGWVDLAYSPDNLKRIYLDYRGNRYFHIRHSWEPTYSQQLNQSMDSGQDYLDLRRASMDSLVMSVDPKISSKARIVVDVGGGHGGLIPTWPSLRRKYVLDVSGVQTQEGVEILNSWTELPFGETPDFVMICGLLEHLNDPHQFLVDLRQSIESLPREKSDTILLYFEVPSGVPRRKATSLFRLYVWLSGRKSLWSLLDRSLSKSIRQKLPLRIAEHIQFFTPKGMEELIKRAGLEHMAYSDYEANSILATEQGIRFTNILGVVARLR